MKFRIHRGAEEIGGNCIEMESAGSSILLDLGAPLMGSLHGEAALPDIPGLRDGSNANLLGIVISHPHADHYGLTRFISPSIPIFMGLEADKLLRIAAAFGPFGATFETVQHYKDRQSFKIGPFTLTPFIADHSAFDAYSLLIEADGKSLFYSGDLRGHGWKNWAFEKLLSNPPGPIDAMMLEGTTLGREGNDDAVSEAGLVEKIVEKLNNTDGMVLAAFSGQNIDRFVTFYKATRKAGRTFVADLYVAQLLRSLGRKTLPDPTSNAMRVYLPRRTKLSIVRNKSFDLVKPFYGNRIYPGELRDRRRRLVMSFRASMADDIEKADAVHGARLIYSMWPGYLERSSPNLCDWCTGHGMEFDVIHTSGHASYSDLKKLVGAIKPRALIPVHTLSPDRFAGFGAPILRIHNGVWQEVQ